MQSVRTWDVEDGDAQTMPGVAENSFDFVHSSHTLARVVDVGAALTSWVRILKPGGYMVVTVPDEDLYEQGVWPSRFNTENKWSFTMAKTTSWSPRSINMIEIARVVAGVLDLERMTRQVDFFRPGLNAAKGTMDQTLTPVAESAIEIIWQKRPPATPARTAPVSVIE